MHPAPHEATDRRASSATDLCATGKNGNRSSGAGCMNSRSRRRHRNAPLTLGEETAQGARATPP
eukprot:6198423-Pyramimonas_sp.AAC.1